MADDNQQDGDVQNEPDGIQQPDPNTNGTDGQEDGRQEPRAPWEREGQQFDPATAWKLIQNLREENGTLKHKNGELADKNRAYEEGPRRSQPENRTTRSRQCLGPCARGASSAFGRGP